MNIYAPNLDEIPNGICECGCGKPTKITDATIRSRRWFRGHPKPYLQGHSPANAKHGKEHFNYKGGKYMRGGYVMLYFPSHPMADSKGSIPEHRYIMSEHLGRLLDDDEHIHHINEDRTDNRIENLKIVTASEHMTLHRIKWSRESVIEALCRYFKRFRRSPGSSFQNKVTYLPHQSVANRLFGSWAEALKASGLPPSKKKSH